MLVGQPQFGFSITDPFKKVGQLVYKTHVIGTKAIVKVIKDPRVQQAAAQSAQQYAASQGGGGQYAAQYAKYSPYVQAARNAFMPGQQPGVMMPPQQVLDNEGEPMPASSPVQHGNFMFVGALVGVGVLAFLLLRK